MAKRQEEICNLLEANREEIESGELVVYLIDECHLLWGDVCGYGWGATEERLEIPMTNERDCLWHRIEDSIAPPTMEL